MISSAVIRSPIIPITVNVGLRYNYKLLKTIFLYYLNLDFRHDVHDRVKDFFAAASLVFCAAYRFWFELLSHLWKHYRSR